MIDFSYLSPALLEVKLIQHGPEPQANKGTHSLKGTRDSHKLGFPGGSAVKNPPAMQEPKVLSLVWEDTLE